VASLDWQRAATSHSKVAEYIAMRAVPTLDDIAREPLLAQGLPQAARNALIARAAAVVMTLTAGADVSVSATLADTGPVPDRLLGVKEAAARLGIHPDTLYRGANDLPFTVRLSPAVYVFPRTVSTATSN